VAAWIARESDAGRPVVLNVFASWCGPCRDEMPLLLKTADEHPSVMFAGVDHLDHRDDGQRFIDEFDVDFPTFHDLTGLTAAWIGGRGMPVTGFFDASGRLVHTTSGPVTPAILDEQLAVLEASIPDA
jgi:cytochrome c biogenesis protein CcmG/thiol:disulfide interchange protein DsbE